jgi:hypothetical protein
MLERVVGSQNDKNELYNKGLALDDFIPSSVHKTNTNSINPVIGVGSSSIHT